MLANRPKQTARHIVESRTLHIQERSAVLKRQPKDWPYREACEAEIRDCNAEIKRAARA